LVEICFYQCRGEELERAKFSTKLGGKRMKKSVIIGSLVAGAFLLPALANAGVASGRCDKCHTMHASQDGSTRTANSRLLIGEGCTGCHTTFGPNVLGLGSNGAPQVDDTVVATSTLSGGYFTAGNGADEQQHNITGFSALDSNISGGGTIPGSTTTYNQAAQIECTSCHAATGGHHSTGGAYRMLRYGTTDVAGTEGTNYGMAIGRDTNSYDPSTMNAFCGSCHTDFHGVDLNDTNLTNGTAWIRHPVNITLTSVAGSYTANYAAAGALDVSPLGEIAGTKDTLLCLSCHLPHGGPNGDILAFSYSVVLAGDTTDDGGCEACHSYGGNGM
jgi:predicted CXXCH cytochrome family protein